MSHEQIQYFALDRFRTKPQIRKVFDAAIIAALAQSLKRLGQLVPVRGQLCADGYIDMVDGEQRLRAARTGALDKLATILEEKDFSEAELLQRQYVTNCHRDGLKPVERARAIESLQKFTGWSGTQLAAELALSDTAVSRAQWLLKNDAEVLKLVDSGAIAESAAVELAHVEDAGLRSHLTAKLLKGELTRDALVGLRKRGVAVVHEPNQPISRVTAPLGNGRAITISGVGLSSLDDVIVLLQELLVEARKGQKQGLELPTWTKILKDQAKRGATQEVPRA